jgi:WD40 repeat protein/MinD-like ATPase involved in chromosome partitioning or flagellar assembly
MSPPRIITFYSYKGGTGRSMALANIAWLLAANGKHVLVIDWDLEAPGLHRYLHPFLRDKELTKTDGLIDFVVQYASMATTRSARRKKDWYLPYANIVRYAASLNYPFQKGTLDFVPAGRQGADYAIRVNSFNWQHLNERLDGVMFFEAAKESMSDYDYVLIDSRTGVSDTSGICTINMPDLLVVCFTLNIQSIEGAAAVAESADVQRRDPQGRPTLKIFPVPTRVELAEQSKLESAREVARDRFNPFLHHLGDKRNAYWEGVEVRYQPFYAYEEMLAVFGDSPGKPNSMLSAMETLTGYLTSSKGPLRMPALSQAERDIELAKYSREARTIIPNLMRRLQGHTGSVRSVSLSSDAKLALSGSEDTTVRLWDLSSAELLRTFQGHTDAVQTVALSSDGAIGISGSNDGTIIIWNLDTGKVVKRLTGHSAAVHAVALSANAEYALSGSKDKTVVLWDLKTGQKLKSLRGHSEAVAAVAISPDGRFAASGSYDKIIVLWDLKLGRSLRTFSRHKKEVTSLVFSHDAQRLLSGSSDQTLMLWDVESARLIRNMTSQTGRIYSVDLSVDGRCAVSGSADRTVALWNVQTGELLRTFEGHSKAVNSVKLSTDARSVISASEDGSMIVWDLSGAMPEVKEEVVVKPRPADVTIPASKTAKTATAPMFYLSFARIDGENKYFTQFVSDLSMEISMLQGTPVSLFQDPSVGESWSESLRNAVRTCRVAICVLTPAYFASESCGKEYEIFRQRSARQNRGDDGIFSVSWIPVKDSRVFDLQMFSKDVPEVYVTEGLSFLMRLSRYRDDYQRLIRDFARQLHYLALNSPLPELPELPPVDHIPNAFSVEANMMPGGGGGSDAGPRQVSFVFAADSPFGTPLEQIAFEVAMNLGVYASIERNAHPKTLVNEIERTALTNTICIIAIDPANAIFLERVAIDAPHCAVLVVGKERYLPPSRDTFGYISPSIQSESEFRNYLESAIVRIRHSMISKSTAAESWTSIPSPSIPST